MKISHMNKGLIKINKNNHIIRQNDNNKNNHNKIEILIVGGLRTEED